MASYQENPAFRARLNDAVQEGVNAYLLVVSRTLRAELSKPGTGRTYRRSTARGRALRRAKTVEQVEAVNRRFKAPRNLREAGFHRASRPGEPPAVDTGLLRRSWSIGRGSLRGTTGGLAVGGEAGGGSVGRTRGRVSSAVVTVLNGPGRFSYRYGSALKYARIEYGWGRVQPRPYIRPTIQNVKTLFQPVMARALRRAFGGGV